MAADGLITIPSSGTVKATLYRLESEVKARGITVFARIDHAAGAASAGLAMRPTELLIFGNAALTSEPRLASVLNPCHRDLIPCSIDLTRCSTDLIRCSIT